MNLYLLLYGQSKNTWAKDSDWIGLGSFPAMQRLHSALIPGTNLHTLEFKPSMLFLNLNKNSRHLLLKYPLFHSPQQNLIIAVSGLVTPVISINVFAVFKFSIFQRCNSLVSKIRLNGFEPRSKFRKKKSRLCDGLMSSFLFLRGRKF